MLLPGFDTVSMGGLQKSYTVSLWQHGGPMFGPTGSLELGVATVLAVRLGVAALTLLGLLRLRRNLQEQKREGTIVTR